MLKSNDMILEQLEFIDKNIIIPNLQINHKFLISLSKNYCKTCNKKTYEECNKCKFHTKINKILQKIG